MFQINIVSGFFMVTLVLLGGTIAYFAMELFIRIGTRNEVKKGEGEEAAGRAGWGMA